MDVFNRYSTAMVVAALIAGCSGSTKNPTDSGPQDEDGGVLDSGMVTYTPTTVENAFTNATTTLKDTPVQITGAVVVSAYSFMEDGVPDGTFYIQDSSGSSGIAVYHGKADMTPFPSVGDVVTVEGKLAYFDESLQISSSAKYNIPLVITITSTSGGTVPATAGAMPPAGTPLMFTPGDIPSFAYNVPSGVAHYDLIGNVLQFSGPLQVTAQYPCETLSDGGYEDGGPCFVETKADGGVDPEGFQVGSSPGVNDGLWIYDYNTYYDCMKGFGADGGDAYPTLTNGIRGVWDRYQDYGGGSMAPTFPMLIPMGCADYLGGAAVTDGGTDDAGTTDAGTTDGGADAGSVYNPPG